VYKPPADGDELEKRNHRHVATAARRRLSGLKFLDESGQKNLLRKERLHPRGCLTGDGDGQAPQPLDGLNHAVHLTMSYCGTRILMVKAIEHFRQVTRAGADIQGRGSDTQNIIDLTWMANPKGCIAAERAD
jgi:hypothetical protein